MLDPEKLGRLYGRVVRFAKVGDKIAILIGDGARDERLRGLLGGPRSLARADDRRRTGGAILGTSASSWS